MIINCQNLNMIQKQNTNNTMSIVIEYTTNTNYEIQIWIIKTYYKLYIHKIREHKIWKAQKIKMLKMLKPKRQTKPHKYLVNFYYY